MKLKGVLLTTALTAMLGVGVFAGVSNNRNEPVEKAEAAVTSVVSGQKFYVDCSATNWYVDGAWIGLYFFGGTSTATFTDFTQTKDSNNMFVFTVPGSNQTFTTLIALRKSNSNKDWSGEWNRVSDFSINGNGIKLTSFSSAEGITVYGGFNSGNQVYVNYNAIDSWWASDDIDNYVYFCNPGDGISANWVKMSKVQGTNDHILECTVPGSGKSFSTAIAARVKKGETPTSNWSNVYNQSVDYTLYSKTAYTESTTKNGMVLQNATTGGKQNVDLTYSYTIQSEQRALWYGKYFISQTDSTCTAKTAPSAETWTGLSTEYSAMNSAAQTKVKNADARKYDKDDSSAYVSYEEAMRRYDLIVSLRRKSNFMNRTVQITSGSMSIGFLPTPADSTGATTAATVVASVMAIATATGFLFLKKKKISK